MPSTCENCTHWAASEAKGLVNGKVGTCRAEPPKSSYSWPRTQSTDYCARHSATQAPRTAAPRKPSPLELKG